MAEDLQWVKAGLTHSLRNQRMLDRTQLHSAKTMQSVSAAFAIFEGASPDYFYVSGFLTTYKGTTSYSNTAKAGGVNSDFLKVNTDNTNASGSILLYENGALHKGPIPSGTVLLDPRTFFDKRTVTVEPTIVISGEITVAIQSGQIKNFVF